MAHEADDQFRAIRVDYRDEPLLEDQIDPCPLVQFERWLDEAVTAGLTEANAMVVATTDGEEPSARTVLLKGVDSRGFAFFTNRKSRKGRDLRTSPRATLVFPWLALQRQVLVSGHTVDVPDDEADAYFRSRPRSAQLGAWASKQSETLTGREELDEALAAAGERWPGEVPRPSHWGGYLVMPHRIEFWQGRPSRLHDRLAYERDALGIALPVGAELDAADRWTVRRLSP